MCTRSVPSHSGGDSEGEVWFKVSACVSAAAAEEGAGTEAGGGHGHDPQQGSTRAALHTAG